MIQAMIYLFHQSYEIISVNRISDLYVLCLFIMSSIPPTVIRYRY